LYTALNLKHYCHLNDITCGFEVKKEASYKKQFSNLMQQCVDYTYTVFLCVNCHTFLVSCFVRIKDTFTYTVGYATTNECYNEQFLSIKSGCYNERGGTLSAHVTGACARCVGPSHFD